MPKNPPHDALKHHVTGAIERGEGEAITEQRIKVTVTFAREECDDDSPDLSYLEQDYNDVEDAAERVKYREQDRARLDAYRRDEWRMIGIRAKATIWIDRPGYRTNYTLESPGLWGIESDSGEAYFAEVFADECATLRADIEALKLAEFKS